MSVLFATTSPDMLAQARRVLRREHSDIRFFQIPWDMDFADSGIVDEVERNNIEAIIARGAVAKRVRGLGLPVSVVDLPVLAPDLIATLNRAKKSGRRVAAVASRGMLSGIENLGPSLGLSVTLYHLDEHVSSETLVRQAVQDGADVIVGSYVTTRAAKNMGLPAQVIVASAGVITQAAVEAKRIAMNLAQERAKSVLFKTLLDYTTDAVVAVDDQCRIVAWNPEAERLTGLQSDSVQKRDLFSVCPELRLDETIAEGHDEQGLILTVNGTDVVCHKRAVIASGKPVAAFAAFQEVSRIQQIEARVRRKIYENGHTATSTFADIKGAHPLVLRAISIAKEFAITKSSVMLLGETGVGKELFAQSLHNYSERAQGPFVAINCAALPSDLLESELFGYVGGAFTGANPKGKPGMFELAHGGTILLDEVGEMDLMLQGKLLRVLEERKVMRLGSERLIPVDVRVITSTNQDLQALIGAQRFRQDLYYRLNVLRLTIPPLRERPSDIPILAAGFLGQHAAALKRRVRLGPGTAAILQRHDWPGNCRELRNFMERVAVVSKGNVVDAEEVATLLAEERRETAFQPPPIRAAEMPGGRPGDSDLDPDLAAIEHALRCTKGNASQAARLLGISRITLWRKVKRGKEISAERA
ncbi:sigma 54-interacting transcriptional regulator [Oleispirillum naphthae]|uniref:sigma 54-interacting transcriptional regulator n=1 Tax=Oleispirillum naphthae TaxID=2838853 RepID=UPI0030826B74